MAAAETDSVFLKILYWEYSDSELSRQRHMYDHREQYNPTPELPTFQTPHQISRDITNNKQTRINIYGHTKRPRIRNNTIYYHQFRQ
jgi:hypothetical protein